MDFKRKASVKYNDFMGTNAADMSSMMIDSFTCEFFSKHHKDDRGKIIDNTKSHLRAIRAYYHEDHPDFVSVAFRMEDDNHKKHDYYIEKVSLHDFFSLFKRGEFVMKQFRKAR